MSKKNRREFSVYARLDISTSITIIAESLEDALAQARTLEVHDFADLVGDHVDGEGVILKGIDEL